MNRLTASCILFAAYGGVVACSPTNKMVEIRPIQSNPVAQGTSAMKGRELFSHGQYALAIESFRRVVREAPDAPEGYNGLAACYDMIGRFDVSEKYYQMALARAPMDGRIYRNMARSMDMQGRKGEGLALLAEWDAIEAGKMVVAALPNAAPATSVAEAAPAPAPVTAPIEVAAPVEAMAAPAPALPVPALTAASAPLILAAPVAVSKAVANATPLAIPTLLAPVGAPEYVAAPIQPAAPAKLAPVKLAIATPAPVKAPVKAPVTVQPRYVAALTAPTQVITPVKVLAPVKIAASAQAKTAPAPVQTVTIAKPTPAPVIVAALAPLRSIAAKHAIAPVATQPSYEVAKQAVKAPSKQVAKQVAKQAGRQPIRLVNAAGQYGLARWVQQHLAMSGINQTQTGNATRRYRLSWVVYPHGQRDRALAVQKSLPFPTRILQEARASRIVVVLGANARGMQTAALKTRRG